jgi:5'-nucleotidase/UDP-sugar diphosphatase
LAVVGLGCSTWPQLGSGNALDVEGETVRLTLLHTSDIHSRLLPYHFDPSFTDNQLGLGIGDGEDEDTLDDAGPFGGIARIGHILERERGEARRVLHVDSGDCFQGAIIFNEYAGEAEMRLQTAVGLDAAVVANHEFDLGAQNLADQYGAWGGFPLLAANYDFESSSEPWATQLEDMILPSTLSSIWMVCESGSLDWAMSPV